MTWHRLKHVAHGYKTINVVVPDVPVF